MISSDKNVEIIVKLIDKLKHYLNIQTEYVKLDLTEKIVRVLTVISLIVIALIAFMIIGMFLSVAAAYAIGDFVGMSLAFSIVALFYIIFFLLLFRYRKRLIERPLLRLFAAIFLEK